MVNSMSEKQMIEKLREHLRIAESWNWNLGKMSFIDGFLNALNLMTGKNYGFSGTSIYLINDSGERVYV